MAENVGKYMVMSELPTHVSKPQKYVGESRFFADIRTARDWRDFVEETNKRNGKSGAVFLVKIVANGWD